MWEKRQAAVDDAHVPKSGSESRERPAEGSPARLDAPRTQAGGSGGDAAKPPERATGSGEPDDMYQKVQARNPRLSPQARTHLLDGDKHGGGHRHGQVPMTGAKKRWFPEGWSDGDIEDAIWQVLGAPRAVWDALNGDLNVYGEVERVRVKVIIAPSGQIKSAYPLDGDGVIQVHHRSFGGVRLREVPYGSSREVSW